MGGCSGQIEAGNLLELFEKFRERADRFENSGLGCDGLTLIFKDGKRYRQLGSNGIEIATKRIYKPKIHKRLCLCYHFHT